MLVSLFFALFLSRSRSVALSLLAFLLEGNPMPCIQSFFEFIFGLAIYSAHFSALDSLSLFLSVFVYLCICICICICELVHAPFDISFLCLVFV